MIHDAIEFLKTVLNSYLVQKIPDSTASGPKVDYPKIDTDPPTFNLRTVNLLLLNLEEERLNRTANPFVQVNPDGSQNTVSPPLHLSLTLLFSAKFTDYQAALKHLSYTMQFFQAHPVFMRGEFPALPNDVDKLTLEYLSLNNTQKNEIWSSLKVAYLPSVAYRLKMMVYQEDNLDLSTEITQVNNQNSLLQ
ncbi:MAG TPA: hypothetical protein DCS93_36530 [Microscillaceae bacterium]|nr:hypothetical protein [Microscillaceae bacterium]